MPLNMPYGVSPISHAIYNLHMTAFLVCCIIGLVVFGMIGYSLFHFRKSKGAKPADFHENHLLEFIWTLIPFLILIALAIPATNILAKIHNTDESALTIKVVGSQWRWEYDYLDNGIKFFSYLSTPMNQIYGDAPKNKWFLLEVDNEMVVPINTKVKLLITSDDVIHSWWVPELGVKQDAVPGFINENWINVTTPGTYRGQCGELCGVNHGFMPIVVKAVSQDDFNQWVLEKQKSINAISQHTGSINLSPRDLLQLGKKEYTNNCAMCHQDDGNGLPHTFPALKGSRVVTAPLNETIIYVMRGVPSAAMKGFGNILDDTTLAAIISYIRRSWGNDAIIKIENHSLDATPKNIQMMRVQLHTN